MIFRTLTLIGAVLALGFLLAGQPLVAMCFGLCAYGFSLNAADVPVDAKKGPRP